MVTKTKASKKPAVAKSKRSDFMSFKNASKAEEIALYYGFMPTEMPVVTKEDMARTKELQDAERPKRLPEENECYFDICPEEKIAVLRTYFEKNMPALPQPVSLFFDGHFNTNPSKKGGEHECRYTLEMLGTSKSIAEATLIKASLEILREAGFENLYIDLNSIGDRDSITRFHKELTAYYRKNIHAMDAHCRQTLKRDPFELLECENEKCLPLKEEAPKSVSFLSELSRTHFREVLEYLESMDVPYRINPFMIGNRSFVTHTIFQIRSLSDKEHEEKSYPLAVGVRYNSLSKKAGLKRDIPSIGVTIAYKRKNKTEGRHDLKIEKPKIFFIQLGFDAKLKSLHVIEMLRQEGIPISQSLSRDKLAAQVSLAENMKIPYTMIMGQKEAVENSVIVRNMATRSQETVPIGNLSDYLKKIK